jgi:predicted nucleic acid-binding protein
VAVALDSDAVVGFLDAGDALHRAADAAIRELLQREQLVVSAVTYGEVLTGARLGHHDEAVITGFFADLVSAVLPVDERVVDIAARLRGRNRNLRMPDALIFATAEANADVNLVVTGDTNAARITDFACPIQLLS